MSENNHNDQMLPEEDKPDVITEDRFSEAPLQEPLKETVDINGFRVLTLNIKNKRPPQQTRAVFQADDEEESRLEAMLEAHAKERAPQPEPDVSEPEESQLEEGETPRQTVSIELEQQPEEGPSQEEDAGETDEPEESEPEDMEAAEDSEDELPEKPPINLPVVSRLRRWFSAWFEARLEDQQQVEADAEFQEAPPKPEKKTKKSHPKPKQKQEKVISMPEDHPGFLEKKLDAIREKTDEFADTMFLSESEEAVEEEREQRRVEKLIPGTDEEQTPPPKPVPPRHREQEKKREERAAARRAPDTSPKELFRIYSASYKSQSGRLPAQLAVAVLLLAVTAIAGGEISFVQVPFFQEHLRLTGLILALGLVGSCAIGLDALLEGIVLLLRRRPGLNTLSSIGAILAAADALWYAVIGRDGPLPFCGFAALSLWAMAFGSSRKKRGLRDACEDAYTRTQFDRLTMDEGKWNGKGVFQKDPGGAKGFGSQIQEPDGAERVYRFAAPVMMIACVAFGIFSAVGQKSPQMLIWNWSVIFVLATPLSATLAYGLPYAKQVRRLRRSGVVLAGWDGIDSLRGDAGIVLTDRDLFPDGSVQFTGIHNFGDVSLEKLTGCTASMIREADVGLAKIFDDQVRIQGGFYRRVDNLDHTEEGGYTGVIRGDTVMIGTSGYLQVHGVRIEAGYQVRHAVFCVINNQLQGSFALNYSLPHTVKPTIMALLHGGIYPILATRDFNITPDVLRQRFKLPAERMQYPAVTRRYDLSAKGQPHNRTLGALIFREGIVPFTDAILGGRRLRSVVRTNTILTLIASVIGALLGLYLTMMHAYGSLSLMNTLFFLVMWLVPTVLTSNGVDQF